MRRFYALLALPLAVVGFVLLIRFRRKSVARFNRAVTNRITRRFAGRAPGFGIIVHRGRRSGRVYRTPVNVFATPGGFMIALTYGRESEWVQNVLAAGGCTLESRGTVYRLTAPLVVHDPALLRLPAVIRLIPRLGGATDYLRCSVADAAAAGAHGAALPARG
jgi:deazaflavin-dependent oxidoreductase (nitroreductase family)